MSRLIIPNLIPGMPPFVFDMWDPRDMPQITGGCSGGRRQKRSENFHKARAKAKKIAKASKKRNR